MDASADPKSIFRQQFRFNNSVQRNLRELQRGSIDGGNIAPGGVIPRNLLQGVTIGSIIYVASQNGGPIFAQDNPNLSYQNGRLTLGLGPIIKEMTPGSILFITSGSQVAQDNAKLKWNDASGQMTLDGALRVGTTTDAAAEGDFSAGLSGAAARMTYIQANGRLSLLDAAGTEKIRISSTEDSYYNASHNWGIGTPTPRRVLDVSAAVNQMRLTQADNTIFADFSVDGSGNLTVSPTGTQVNVALGANGQKVQIAEVTELTTIAAAATTDTVIQIPANAVVLGVSVRVTVVIPTAATFTVTGTTSGTTFNTAAVSTAATSTDPGTKAGAFFNATAQTIRITPNLVPGANTGRVRVTISYYVIVPPTS